MAMADHNIDWLHIYDNSFPIQEQQHTSSTVANTPAIAAASPSPSPSSSSLQPAERRVAKPTRRRNRASRKTPTTLVNTDTSNFRAMVQHYTGASTLNNYHQPTAGGNLDFQVNQFSSQQQFGVSLPLLHQPSQHQDRGATATSFFLDYNNDNNTNNNARGYDMGSSSHFDRYPM